MTTGISLVRENAESMQPPRSLWVPFPLGRPLGKPNDKAFQHRVIAAALALLERTAGPVLEDYPEDAPTVSIEESAACPVSFGNTQAEATNWAARLVSELTQMQPWYDLGKRRRNGRSLVGVAGEPMQTILKKLGELLDSDTLPTAELKWFKLAIEDAKVFYIEALTAQPGEYSAQAIEQILWHETHLGAGLRVFYERFTATPKLAIMARMVASREAIGGSTGEEIEINDITKKEK